MSNYSGSESDSESKSESGSFWDSSRNASTIRVLSTIFQPSVTITSAAWSRMNWALMVLSWASECRSASTNSWAAVSMDSLLHSERPHSFLSSSKSYCGNKVDRLEQDLFGSSQSGLQILEFYKRLPLDTIPYQPLPKVLGRAAPRTRPCRCR